MVKKIKIQANSSVVFSEGFEEFILNCRSRNLREGTITHYSEGYKSITKFISEDTPIKDITHKTFDDFVVSYRELGVSSQTIYTYSRDLKTMLYFFMKVGHLKQFKITLPKVDKRAIETYSDSELKILLKKPKMKNCNFVEYRDWVIINFLLSTGVRSNSLINIKIKDLDFENEVVYVNMTKNRKPLILPLNLTITKILKAYLKIRQYETGEDYLFPTAFGTKLYRKTLNQTLNAYARNRGVSTSGTHRYRHTYAKKAILKGMNPAILQKVLGHSSLLITQNYLNILVSDLKKEINQFNILNEFSSEFIKIDRG